MPLFEVEVQDQIVEFITEMDALVQAATMNGAQQIAGIAQGLVRIDTESLHDTIDVDLAPSETGTGFSYSVNAGNLEGGYKGGSPVNSKNPGSPVDYATDQEYGPASGGPFTPYMTPAAEQGWPIVQTLVADALRTAAS